MKDSPPCSGSTWQPRGWPCVFPVPPPNEVTRALLPTGANRGGVKTLVKLSLEAGAAGAVLCGGRALARPGGLLPSQGTMPGTCPRWSGTSRESNAEGRRESNGGNRHWDSQPASDNRSRASAAPPQILGEGWSLGAQRGPLGPPRSPRCVPTPAEKGAVLVPQDGPRERTPGAREAPALDARVLGIPAARAEMPGGRKADKDAGAPTCTASLAMSSRRPPGVPARREGWREERACARHGVWRAGRGRAQRDPGPARRPLRPARLRPPLARPPRRAPRPPAPAAAGPVT